MNQYFCYHQLFTPTKYSSPKSLYAIWVLRLCLISLCISCTKPQAAAEIPTAEAEDDIMAKFKALANDD